MSFPVVAQTFQLRDEKSMEENGICLEKRLTNRFEIDLETSLG